MWWMLLMACGSGPSTPPVSAPTEPTVSLQTRTDVDVQTLKAALEQGARVVDVRTPEEFATGHVPGALNVPVDAVDPMNEQLQSLGKENPVYFICAKGGRSASAADELAAAGFKAMNVTGGTDAWRAAGLPLE